jgi:hypothetical protein
MHQARLMGVAQRPAIGHHEAKPLNRRPYALPRDLVVAAACMMSEPCAVFALRAGGRERR